MLIKTFKTFKKFNEFNRFNELKDAKVVAGSPLEPNPAVAG